MPVGPPMRSLPISARGCEAGRPTPGRCGPGSGCGRIMVRTAARWPRSRVSGRRTCNAQIGRRAAPHLPACASRNSPCSHASISFRCVLPAGGLQHCGGCGHARKSPSPSLESSRIASGRLCWMRRWSRLVFPRAPRSRTTQRYRARRNREGARADPLQQDCRGEASRNELSRAALPRQKARHRVAVCPRNLAVRYNRSYTPRHENRDLHSRPVI